MSKSLFKAIAEKVSGKTETANTVTESVAPKKKFYDGIPSVFIGGLSGGQHKED